MKNEKTKKQIFILILILFIVCSICKDIEFLYIRTDERTILADNVLCKIFCILGSLFCMKSLGLKLQDIGLKNTKVLKYLGYGLGLGILTFGISYGLELLLLLCQGKSPYLHVFITNFSPAGATAQVNLSILSLIICIAVNIINVFAEEGMFRGIILNSLKDKIGFRAANYFQALLFGLWHIIICIRNVMDGDMSFIMAVLFAIGYIVLAGILALEWGTCFQMTGILWVSISEHFFNNFIGNFLHVISTTGTDELQIVRVVVSNLLSLGIVLLINKKKNSKELTNN